MTHTQKKEITETLQNLIDESYYLTNYTYLVPAHLPQDRFKILHTITLREGSLFALGHSVITDDNLTHLNVWELTKINNQVLVTLPVIEGVTIKFDSLTKDEVIEQLTPIFDNGGNTFVIRHSDPVAFNGEFQLV
jgi:hypothetical protein